MEAKIKEKLDSMVGKTYNTGERIATFQKWKLIFPNYAIVTTHRTFVYSQKEVAEKIGEWTEIEVEERHKKTPLVPVPSEPKKNEALEVKPLIEAKDLYQSNDTYMQVQNKLMEMMTSISDPKASKETLDRANSACNIASTMIALERLNLQVKKQNERMLKTRKQ